LADEPTGNLDSKTSTEIMDLVSRVSEKHALTLLLVTHDLKLAQTYTHRQLTMDDGKLIQQSSELIQEASSK